MKRIFPPIFFLFILLILTIPDVLAQHDGERAIYVMRHAEKKADKDDPALSNEGEERAGKLKEILKDKDIKAVYSSDTKRTRHTIIPFADNEGLYLQIYDTDDHGDLVAKLQEEEDNVVVIGHSNTVHHIINLLIGRTIMEELDESDYENIFIVYIDDEGGTRLESKKYSDFE
ncbi:MAG TPA: phosphoglycerate mutase family protein [Anditalea sp.]|nr:phosphoglycerate mutase family protein [Anditalea sp.]